MSTISHELVTSRKAHQCTYCERIIAAGSSVVRHVYRDGGICTSYAHAECQLAADIDATLLAGSDIVDHRLRLANTMPSRSYATTLAHARILDLLDERTALTARAEQAERVARAASLFFDTQHTMYVETEGNTHEHFAEEAEDCGLMEWTSFDPTKHKCFGDPAPGERVFMPTELGWEVLKYRPPPADALDRAGSGAQQG